MCFRNTAIEDFHDGIAPVSHTGDFSDVVVIDANGRRIPWPEVALIEPDEMRELMRQVVNRLYTCHLKAGDPQFFGMLDWAAREAREWDEPALDEVMLKGLEARRSRGRNERGAVNGCSVGGVSTGMSRMIEPVARIRIELQDLEPKIWRRVDVPLSSTLASLNDITQVSFHWQDYHLYEFVVGERVYGVPTDEDEFYDRKTYMAA